MKKIIIYVGIITLAIIIVGSYFFYKKHYLNYELTCKLPNVRNGEFYPNAYVFFHNKKSFDRFFDLTNDTKKLKQFIPKEISFDFSKYSYCIFYVRKVNSMYYSYKTTYYDDPSPSYTSCRRKGKKFVVANYYTNTEKNNRGIFLYKVIKNNSLSGVDGL